MPSKTQSILLGALVGTVLGLVLNFLLLSGGTATIYLGTCAACLIAFVGPATAVWHYTNTNNLTLPVGPGAGLGASTGVVGGLLAWAVTFAMRAAGVFPTAAEMQARMAERMNLDPSEMPDMSDSFMSTPVGELVVGLIVGAIVGAIGGAIAASIFKKGSADYEV